MTRARTLSIILLTRDIRDARQVLDDTKAVESHVVAVGPFSGELFIRRSSLHPPLWASYLGPHARPPLQNVLAASSSALLVTRIDGRLFALTFGYGRTCWPPVRGRNASVSW